MKTKSWLIAIGVVCVGLFFACSGEEADKKAKSEEINDVVVLPGEDTTARMLDNFDKDAKVITTKNFAIYKKVSKKYKGISCFTVVKNGLLFLRQSKEGIYTTDGKLDKNVRYGLVDGKGKELLAMRFEKISNPGFVCKDMVEFKEAGKYGLYNYMTNEMIPAKYDVIYPSKIMEYIAIGDVGGKLYKIYKDGTQKALKKDENAPNYFNLLKDFRFNYSSSFFAWWYETFEFDYMNDERDYASESVTVIPPSYMDQLQIYPAIMTSLFAVEDTLDITPVKQVKRNDDITALTTNVFAIVAESRGYTESRTNLITLNKKNRVQRSIEVYQDNEYMYADANNLAKPSLKFLNDSIVEVKNFKYVEKKDAYNPYTYRTIYEYYSIKPDGKIETIGVGNYPMISATELSRNHFKGCFIYYLTEEEKEQEGYNTEEYEYDMIYQCSDHLSAANLEFMMNELYARKGMKFNDPELHDYFSQFTWYKPKFKSVDSKLTDIEKKNIATIKRLLKDVKSNPSKFIHKTTDASNAAG